MAGIPYATPATLDELTEAWIAAIQPWSRSRPLPGLDNAALLVLDVQRYFADPTSHAYLPALEAVFPRILGLVRCFGRAGRPVVVTQHGSTNVQGPRSMMQRWWRDDLQQDEERAQLVDELAAIDVDHKVHKTCYSAFHQTDLKAWLDRHECETVVICGVMTHLCCESTARGAFMHDLQPVMVADACASMDEELHLGALRALAHGFAVISSSRQIQAALERVEHTGVSPATEGATRERPNTLPRELDLAVVGAGPGGIAAAIQARRQDLKVALLDSGRPGGQAHAAERIENYPGFPGGIPGSRLMRHFVAHARQLQLSIHPAHLLGVSVSASVLGEEGRLQLHLARRDPLSARAVILATGSAPRRLETDLGPGEEIVCHQVDQIPVVRGRRILVVGGGEAAFDQALLASRLGASTVTLAMRGDAPRAIDLLVRRAEERGIELLAETTVCGVSDQTIDETGRRVALSRRGDTLHLLADAVVVCIGKVPRLPELPPGVLVDGRPAVDKLGRTPVKGLYMVGDIHRGPYRQVAIAVGDGVAAAMHAARFIRGGDWRS